MCCRFRTDRLSVLGSESGPVPVSEASGVQTEVSRSLVFILISVCVHSTVTKAVDSSCQRLLSRPSEPLRAPSQSAVSDVCVVFAWPSAGQHGSDCSLCLSLDS